MCTHLPLDDAPLSHKMYSTWERSQAQGTIKPCRECPKRRQKKCLKSHEGTSSSPISLRKRQKIESRGKQRSSPQNLKGQMINRRTGYTVEISDKKVSGRTHFKVIPIVYGRTIDRWKKAIHE